MSSAPGPAVGNPVSLVTDGGATLAGSRPRSSAIAAAFWRTPSVQMASAGASSINAVSAANAPSLSPSCSRAIAR